MSNLLDQVNQGGVWLSTIRSWIQRNKLNGSRVTWGSAEPLNPPMTCREIEEVVALAIEADRERILKHFDEAVYGSTGVLREKIKNGIG